jgi:hypothetical protein
MTIRNIEDLSVVDLPELFVAEDAQEHQELVAKVVTSPEMMAAASIASLPTAKQADLATVLSNLQEDIASVAGGSLEEAETMAFAQAKTLDAVFHDLLRNAYAVRKTLRFDYLLKLALRVQAQSARTLETLATLRKPPVFAQQVNMANQQLVANGLPQALPGGEAVPIPASAKPATKAKNTVRSAKK